MSYRVSYVGDTQHFGSASARPIPTLEIFSRRKVSLPLWVTVLSLVSLGQMHGRS